MTLSPRDAKLRAEALRGIVLAQQRLYGVTFTFTQDAFKAAIYNRPGLALRRIARAEAHIKKAKKALKAWAGRPRA